MKLKLFLLVAPLLLILGMLQAYFWVPTYDKQTRGNPERLEKFIYASIGDAKILNPALNADSASSTITDLVFEGLLDMDENLNLRPRLATDWQISETAYLNFQTTAAWQTVDELLEALKAFAAKTPIIHDNLIDMQVLTAKTVHTQLQLKSGEEPLTVELQVALPERIQFNLKQVDQDFFTHLQALVGEDYADTQTWLDDLVVPDHLTTQQTSELFKQLKQNYPTFEHNPVLLFNLRKGVYFHDGHEFDAGDVKFTYEAIMNPKNLSPRTSNFEPIKSVDVLHKYQVRVVYKRLFSPAINAWGMGILPEHLLNQAAMQKEMEERQVSAALKASFGMRDSRFNRKPIGTGSFRFVSWQSDELIHLTRNESYWDGAPLYKDYFYRVIPDRMTQEIEFRTGAIDTYGSEPYQVARYQEDDKYRIFSLLSMSFAYIGYNNRRPLFADKRVRRALGMAVDVDEILRYVLYEQAERTTGPYPVKTDWYDHSIKPLPYDPQGALALLGELGWQKNADGWLEKDGKLFEFNLITNNGNATRKALMTIAQDNWRKIGIKCNTQVFEWAVFLQDFVNPGQFDAVILGWSMSPDPDLFQIWHSSQAGPHQLNFVGYKNPKADELIVRIRQEYNRQRQIELAHELHGLIAEDQPYTFIYTPKATLVFDKKIVMLDEEGKPQPIQPSASGNWMFYFNRWKKLDMSLD